MSRRTILIIDEAADHRDILCRFLRATGYDVVEASPGPELLNATPIFDPDLILLHGQRVKTELATQRLRNFGLRREPRGTSVVTLHDEAAIADEPGRAGDWLLLRSLRSKRCLSPLLLQLHTVQRA